MAFSDEVLRKAWERAGGKCECRVRTHHHGFQACDELLRWDKREQPDPEGWKARQRSAGGDESLVNCEIVCWECEIQIPD